MGGGDENIDLRDSGSVELWCAALRVTTAELVEAVNAVGTAGGKVARYIREKRDAASTKPS